MEEFIDEYSVANEIAFLRDVYQGSVLLVEGPDDGRLMEKFKAREDRCRVLPAFGKQRALGALRILRERGLADGLLVMLDADFWHLTGQIPDDDDIVITDFHDLEMDIVMSAAMDDLLREMADSGLVSAFEDDRGGSVVTALMRELAEVSVIRYANATRELFLRFSYVDIGRYVDEHSARVDVHDYIQAVLDQSHHGVELGEVVAAAEAVTVADSELNQAVRGHDFTILLGIALRHLLGRCPPDIGCGSHVEALLRLAYGREHFERSELYSSILSWEERTGGSVLD